VHYLGGVSAARHLGLLALLIGTAVPALVQGTPQDPADYSIRQFLQSMDERQPPYHAMRRLVAENGSRRGWLDATTEYSPATGFSYQVTAEGGSGYIRTRVLRRVLDGEREAIAKGEIARSALGRANYTFQPNGVDAEGLANVLLSPRRKDRVLVSGTMFLQPDGALVRLQGRLAKSPSFWVKNVDIVRCYERIAGVVVPVSLESKADVRFLGPATLRMTYTYSAIDGRPASSAPGTADTGHCPELGD
jgi:hypothetical protein